MIGDTENYTTLYPVLPNLVTSTDEVTVFATSTIINGKDSLYIVTKPSKLKNELCDSSTRNNYKKNMSGDAHLRGVCIVINSTFTAGVDKGSSKR